MIEGVVPAKVAPPLTDTATTGIQNLESSLSLPVNLKGESNFAPLVTELAPPDMFNSLLLVLLLIFIVWFGHAVSTELPVFIVLVNV